MKVLTEPTFTARIYMAGDIEAAKRFMRRECYPPNEGLCVTIEPTTFIYSGGEEPGFVVGFANNPRFTTTPAERLDRAKSIAERMLEELCQWSAMLVTPSETTWMSLRPESQS